MEQFEYMLPHRSYVLSRLGTSHDFDGRKFLRACRTRMTEGRFGTEGGVWQLEIHPTNYCSLNCTGCSYGNRHDSSALKPETVRSIVNYYVSSGVRSVFISGGGDPAFWNGWVPVFGELDCSQFDLGVATSLSSLSQIGRVINRIRYFQIHVVGFDRESVMRETGRDFFERIRRNLERLFEVSNSQQQITLKVLVKDSNAEFLSRFLDFVAEFPAMSVVLKLQQNFLVNKKEVSKDTILKVRGVIESHEATYRYPLRIDNLDTAPKEPVPGVEPTCIFPRTGMYRLVRPDGLIYPCVAAPYSKRNAVRAARLQLEMPFSHPVPKPEITVSKCPREACRHHLLSQFLEEALLLNPGMDDELFPPEYTPSLL